MNHVINSQDTAAAVLGRATRNPMHAADMFNKGEGSIELSPAEVSDRLQSAGIPGIRYLDQGSRGAGEGTSNYVVFDPRIIEILRKYGIFGALAPAAAGSAYMNSGQPQQW